MSISTLTNQRIAFFTRAAPAWRFDRPASALTIETLALPDEPPGRLTDLFQEYLDEMRPATRSQLELVEHLTVATIERQRIVQARAALVAEKVRTADFRFAQAEQTAVEAWVELLPSHPRRALAGLNATALGTRYQIARWERLQTMLDVEHTWYGQHRDEVTLLLGAKPGLEHLAASETGYLVRLYCLFGQVNPKHEDVNDLANPAVKPETFRDHDPDDWAPAPSVCRRLLEELAARELVRLRARESWLRVNVEQPARELARAQARVLSGKELDLLAAERHHDRMFHSAYKALTQRNRRGGRRFAARREGAEPATPPPVLRDTPPPCERAAVDVLDYYSAHRAALEPLERACESGS
jgi:hypothetical protein